MKRSEMSPFGTVSRANHDSSGFYSREMYAGLAAPEQPEAYVERPLSDSNVIYHADSRDMSGLPDSSVHLMVTSPPYNVGKEYDDDLTLGEYEDLLFSVMGETYRVLVTGGRACVNIANVGRSPYIPLHSLVIGVAFRCGFVMRGEVIWDKGASAGTSCAWGSWRSASNPSLRDVHEYILIFSKQAFKRETLNDTKRDSIGRDDFLEFTQSVWRFPAASARRARHPAPFPVELPRRLIQLYSFVGDVVLDPFMGSGTTAIAALSTGRRYIGYELDRRYAEISETRIGAYRAARRQTSLF